MARKKKKVSPHHVACSICDELVLRNAPAEGVVYQIGSRVEAICWKCGITLTQVIKTMKLRWG